jgi:phosphoglycolate phosphatase-like HAD superfamily hydrolase
VHKPNPDVFLPSINVFAVDGINKAEILYVGDTLDDYFSAVNAGLIFCGISGRTAAEQFDKQNAKYITDIVQLPEHIYG